MTTNADEAAVLVANQDLEPYEWKVCVSSILTPLHVETLSMLLRMLSRCTKYMAIVEEEEEDGEELCRNMMQGLHAQPMNHWTVR